MSKYEQLARRYTSAAEKDLEPIVQEAAAAGCVSDASVEQLRSFLVRAWMAGATAAVSDEMVAEAAAVGQSLKRSILQTEHAPNGHS